jgi:uncharacterized protein YndB with AHSA1/START domain
MKRPKLTERPIDDKAMAKETGHTRSEWFKEIDRTKADGRSAIGKALLAKKVDAWWMTVITVDYEARAGIVEKDGRPKGYSLCITKSVAAPVSTVFKSFTVARELDKWFGAANEMQATDGGSYRNADGNTGSVNKVRPDKALALSWDARGFAERSQVEVLFQPKGDKCGIVVNHTRVMTRHEADQVRAMWGDALERLKSLLEAR